MTRRVKSSDQARVLVVDDDDNLLRLFDYNLGRWGYQTCRANSGSTMHQALADNPFDLILLDVQLPDGDGIEFLASITETYPLTKVVMVTAHGTVDMAMDAVRLGAFDFLTKPVDLERLKIVVRNAVELSRSEAERNNLQAIVAGRDGFGNLIGTSSKMQVIYEMIANVAASDCAVLITGETGTGKELVASEIHGESHRGEQEMVTVNCAAIPRELVESEMFGHEKGAFTGAVQRKIGCAERANNSSLFLDEIGELDVVLQAKLLRFLQDGTFTRVGQASSIRSDARIISATNRDPAAAVAEGLLRQDLLYRINVVRIDVPPLRERRGDIPLLAESFLREATEDNHKSYAHFSDEIMHLLMNYTWPGNVRELKNVVTRMVVLNSGDSLESETIPIEIRESVANADRLKQPISSPPSHARIRPFWESEKAILHQALLACQGNVGEASKRLEVSRATLYRKITQYDLGKKGAGKASSKATPKK